MTNRIPALWLDPGIPGYAARLGQLDPGNPDDTDLLPPLAEFVPDDGPNLFRFTTKHEIVSHVRRVFALWRQNADGIYVLAAPSLAELGHVLEATRALQQQVVAAGEVMVTTSPDGQLGFGFRSIRARIAVESMAAFTRKQRFAACDRCGGWFPIQRAGAKYCSGRCQVARYREVRQEDR